MTDSFTTGAEPVLPWFGGKRSLAKRIVARINTIPHKCYAEPFVGMGGVFLRRAKRARYEAINDAEGEIVNLFRVLKEHPDELIRQCRYLVPARVEFGRLLIVDPATLTDVQRAARFIYLQRLTFGGRPATLATPGSIGFGPTHKPATGQTRLRRLIDGAAARLEQVQIECLDWAAFVRRYDRAHTLFYLDPPYWGHETDYGRGMFAQEDFVRMADMLGQLRGAFILSLNDRPEVRETFAGFRIETITTRYSANAKNSRPVDELLISNIEVDRLPT